MGFQITSAFMLLLFLGLLFIVVITLVPLLLTMKKNREQREYNENYNEESLLDKTAVDTEAKEAYQRIKSGRETARREAKARANQDAASQYILLNPHVVDSVESVDEKNAKFEQASKSESFDKNKEDSDIMPDLVAHDDYDKADWQRERDDDSDYSGRIGADFDYEELKSEYKLRRTNSSSDSSSDDDSFGSDSSSSSSDSDYSGSSSSGSSSSDSDYSGGGGSMSGGGSGGDW